MATIIKLRRKQLRGPRYRQERRHLRRGTWIKWSTARLNASLAESTVAMQKFIEAMNALADFPPIVEEAEYHYESKLSIEEEVPKITIVGKPYACKTCGSTGDDPCMTKSGKIATKEHSGRTVL